MSNERWNSPFGKTIAFVLFSKHFTELNDIYWAHVPAASTIESKAKKALASPPADPKTFFLIRDEDDRRLASTFDIWKSHYRDFSNYTRLNMLMLLSSCFETYLRTVVSLAMESKPGCIIGCPEAIDGVFLLRTRPNYGNIDSTDYQFADIVTSICKMNCVGIVLKHVLRPLHACCLKEMYPWLKKVIQSILPFITSDYFVRHLPSTVTQSIVVNIQHIKLNICTQ